MKPIITSQKALDTLANLFNVDEATQDDVYAALAGVSSFAVGVKNEDGEPLEILIHGTIGDPWEELDSASVARLLSENKGRDVKADINSPGGLAFDGIAIYNSLATHTGHVEATITGNAASAATIIAMGADNIRIAKNASFMVHRAIGFAVGNQPVMSEMSTILDMLDGQIAETYAARTGGSVNSMLEFMTGEVDGTWFSADEALENGFVDEVLPLKSKKKPAKNSLPAKGEEHPVQPGPTSAEYRQIADAGLERIQAAMAKAS